MKPSIIDSDNSGSHRIDQLNSLILQEVAAIVSREVEFPSGMFVTISNVNVADDAESAKVWVSVLPDLHKQDALDLLNSRIGDIQSVLNKKLVMKFVPKLTFFIDESGEKAATITKVLDIVAADDGLGLGLDAEKVEAERLEREAKKPAIVSTPEATPLP